MQKYWRFVEVGIANPHRTAIMTSVLYLFAGGIGITFMEEIRCMLIGYLPGNGYFGRLLFCFFITVTTGLIYIVLYTMLDHANQKKKQLQSNNQYLEMNYETALMEHLELEKRCNEARQTIRVLAEKEGDLRALFMHMHEAFFLTEIICDQNGAPMDYRYLAVNRAYEKLVGRCNEEIVGHTVSELIPEAEKGWLDTFGRVALTRKPISTVYYVETAKKYYSIMAYSPKRGQCASLLVDVTAQKQQEEHIHHLAFHDALTSLPNRHLFADHIKELLKQAQKQSGKFALFFLDLDDFKRINDTLGHEAGDEFLIVAAERLRVCCRPEDLVARLGGDEFAIILPGIGSVENALPVAERIGHLLKNPWCFEHFEFRISAAIGIAFYPHNGLDFHSLLKSADLAMYKAKNDGKSCYCFYHDRLHDEVSTRVTIENDLHYAIDRQELVLHFQPQFNVGQSIIGFEALVRWQHPTKGLLYPDSFITIAEDTGLIVPIGEWVLREACLQMMLWRQEGFVRWCISVNLSAKQIQDRLLVKKVKDILAETQLPPDLLELEITESVAMKNADLSRSVMDALCAMGVQLALDDFGTGYSSLKYLQQFPIHRMKIDKSFVRGIDATPDNRAIVKAIIDLAKNLRVAVIAEGVETVGEFQCLRKIPCSQFQGYYFGRPRSAEDNDQTILRGRCLINDVEKISEGQI